MNIIKWGLIILLSLAAFFQVAISLKSQFYNPRYSILYNEFVQSTNFSTLLKENISPINTRNIATFNNLGFPYSPQNETVFGTNRGVRIVPLLLALSTFQYLFGVWWDRIYFFLILLLPFLGFLFAYATYGEKEKKYDAIVLISLFYAFSPWIFMRLVTGFWQLHIAYAALPIILFGILNLITNSQERISLWRLIIIALSMFVVYLFQPHSHL